MSKVSVVIPAYQGERYIGAAIESILNQSAAVDQIVVVDDGSTDATAAVAQRYPRVTLAREAHRGIGGALNRGVELATGDHLAFLDADDLWTRHKIERQLERLAREPGADLALGLVRQFLSPDIDASVAARVVCPPEPQPGHLIGSLLLRRSQFERVGRFRDDWPVGHFIDWFTRARELGLRETMVPEVVLLRRLHGANIGLRDPAARVGFVQAAKASLDRRRRRQ
jgi:glycosyltransferase involved in cell wall biosynthesis